MGKIAVITGSSNGIGLAAAKKFVMEGWEVHGIDKLPPPKDLAYFQHRQTYVHHLADVGTKYSLPIIQQADVLINNAGVQNSEDDIGTNLRGVINCTENYGLQSNIKSIVNLASVSAHTGSEFGEYCASKGGVLAYTKWTAKEVAKYGATCNSLSFGGVLTDLNKPVTDDQDLWNEIMELTPLKKWATPEECALWIYFVSVVNKSMTGQDIIIDNGESGNQKFIWPNS